MIQVLIDNSKFLTFKYSKRFQLESGKSLPQLEIAYTTHGTLSPTRDNVVWVFHALTANADPTEWWPGLVGSGHIINPENHFIVCANILGSCYGTTGAGSLNPETGQAYGLDFPAVCIKDIVNAHKLLKQELNIDKIHLGIGGSMGGQQLLEWAAEDSSAFENICLLATNAKHSAWGIAFNASQRMAMEADASLKETFEGAGKKGLEAARAIALLSYRNQKTYNKTQTDDAPITDGFKASSYQYYQGKKLSERFNAHAYYSLSKTMDSHNVGRDRKSIINALAGIRSNVLVMGIKSDLLFSYEEQHFIARHIPNAKLVHIDSFYGHDGFLIETETITQEIKNFLK